ncbi:his operon leader peptide [Enterobacter hormaechei]|nr:his operon leader peptide [Enterobacter hormaechei]MCF2195190.1 his operon leader peptide [Enterobacter hormaechei]MCM7526553.1 his operon leader peptide [Enterobacter hormaechei]
MTRVPFKNHHHHHPD